MYCQRTISCVFFLLMSLLSSRQSIAQEFVNFEHYNIDKGLSQNTVNCTIQDRFGFMWFGTKDGLNRFDGNRFKVYRHISQDSTSLGSNYILSLCLDSNDRLWVGTDKGLFRYEDRFDKFQEIKLRADDGNSISCRINEMHKDRNGNLWIAAGFDGIFCIHPDSDSLQHYTLKQRYTKCLEEDSHGDLWVGTVRHGLLKFDRRQNTFIPYSTKGLDISSISMNDLLSGDERLYIGTIEKGLLVLQNDSVEYVDCSNFNFHNAVIHALSRNTASEILVGGEELIYYNEISRTAKVHRHISSNPHSLSDGSIYSIFKDREKGIWLGTYFDGINYMPYPFAPFRNYYPEEGKISLASERVREMCEDKDGHLWIGTEGSGLSCMSIATRQFVQYPINRIDRSPAQYNIHGLACDDQYLWIGYYMGGFDKYCLETGEVTHYSIPKMLGRNANEDMFAICRSKSGNKLWLGTVTGVYAFNIDREELTFIDKIGIPFVYDIQEDKCGRLWIATLGSGAMRYDPRSDNVEIFRHKEDDTNSMPSDKVISVHIRTNNDVWLTTEGGGICRFDSIDSSFVCVGEKDGLPNNVVYKIVEDEEGHFWFGTNNGLVKYDSDKGTVKTYTTGDVLISNQFNYKSGHVDSHGILYFGTVKGLVCFDPKAFTENTCEPTIALTSFTLFNNEVHAGDDSPLKESINSVHSIELKPTQSTIGLEFACLSFPSPSRNSFVYKLDGVDKNWNTLHGSNKVTYSNLSHGTYTFHLYGINSSGTRSINEKTLTIKVLPPFYLTPLAYCIYGILLLVAIIMAFQSTKRNLIRKQKEQIERIEKNKEKEIIDAKIDFFTKVMHEIRTPLTLISTPLDYILTKEAMSDDMRDNLLTMQQNAHRLTDLSNQLLDFRSVESKSRQLFFTETDITQMISAEINRIRPAVTQRALQISTSWPESHLVASVDHEAMIKIISNLLGNAIKFAMSFIHVSLNTDIPSGSFSIKIENDGTTVPPKQRERIFEPFFQAAREKETPLSHGTGLGLPLARELAVMHGGQLTYNVTEDNTNVFVLSIPYHLDNQVTANENIPSDDDESAITSYGEDEARTPNSKESESCSTILLVEDNEEMLNLTAKWLSDDYHVIKGINGVAALKILQEKEVDIIISDIMMPEMDGLALLHELKNNMQYSHIPVILLTAKTTLNSKIESLHLGADAYIEKPFSYTYLNAQIENLLEKRRNIKQLFSLYPVDAINTAELNDTDQLFWKKINEIIDDNLSNESLSIDLLASRMNMSRSTLKRKFNGLSNLTPNEYIRIYRLRKAADYIKSSQYRISEIVMMTGFSSSSYFAKCFKQQYGVLPKEYAAEFGVKKEEKAN